MNDIVEVTDERVDECWRGTWFHPQFDFREHGGRYTEMITGRVYSAGVTREEAAAMLGLRKATPDEWAHVIGLVVLGAAKKIAFK